VDERPLLVAPVGERGREAAELWAHARAPQADDVHERPARTHAHLVGIRTGRIDGLRFRVDQGARALVAVLVPGLNDGAQLAARLVHAPPHLVALAADLHGRLVLMPLADLPEARLVLQEPPDALRT